MLLHHTIVFAPVSVILLTIIRMVNRKLDNDLSPLGDMKVWTFILYILSILLWPLALPLLLVAVLLMLVYYLDERGMPNIFNNKIIRMSDFIPTITITFNRKDK